MCNFIDKHSKGTDKVLVHCRRGPRAAALLLLQQAHEQHWASEEVFAKGKAMGLEIDGGLKMLVDRFLQDTTALGRGQSFASGLLALVEGQAILEADPAATAGTDRLLLQEGTHILANEFDRLGLPLDGGGEITDLGTGGGERIEAVGILPVVSSQARLASLRAQLPLRNLVV